MLPPDVSFLDAVKLAGAAGKLNAVTTTFDWNDRYNIWSGLIGGMFLALAYFGTDQSQVQRYLTGKSIGQSRLGLLFNAMAKVPMQFFILFIGAMVFVVFLFVRPPLVFQPVVMEQRAGVAAICRHREPLRAGLRPAPGRRAQDRMASAPGALQNFRAAQTNLDAARADALKLSGANDTNYIFLSFVTHYLPVGVVGLVVAVIFTAAMSAISGEINSLATVTVIDIYKRHMREAQLR